MGINVGNYVKISVVCIAEHYGPDEVERVRRKRGFVTRVEEDLAWVAWTDDKIADPCFINKSFLSGVLPDVLEP